MKCHVSLKIDDGVCEVACVVVCMNVIQIVLLLLPCVQNSHASCFSDIFTRDHLLLQLTFSTSEVEVNGFHVCGENMRVNCL